MTWLRRARVRIKSIDRAGASPLSSLSDDFTPHDVDKSNAVTSASWASSRDAAAFAEHLALLTKSGLPLPSGLRALAAEIPSRKLKATLIETADRLDSGV